MKAQTQVQELLKEKLRDKKLVVRLCGERVNSPFGSRRKLYAYVNDEFEKVNIRIHNEHLVGRLIRQCDILVSPTVRSLYDVAVVDNKVRELYEDNEKYYLYITTVKREFVLIVPKELGGEAYVEIVWRSRQTNCLAEQEKRVVSKVECKCDGTCECTSKSLLALVALVRFKEMFEIAEELVMLKRAFTDSAHTGTMEVVFSQDANVCTAEAHETT